MKLLFLIKIFCACWILSSAQPLDTGSALGKPSVTEGSLIKGIPDGKWMGWYKNGTPQFIRTYSSGKWQQFQNEITRYHPKRVSMPITKLYHDNKLQAEKYTKAIISFCDLQNCSRVIETIQQAIEKQCKRRALSSSISKWFITWVIYQLVS